jgi:hypothetical protein
MNQNVQEIDVVRLMSKEEALATDARIVAHRRLSTEPSRRPVAEMRDREGFAALGYRSFLDYCKSIDKRTGHTSTARLVDRVTVESNLGHEVPATHAYALARLPDADTQREVYEAVKAEYPQPIELNYIVAVEHWLRDHKPPPPRVKEGWTREDLEADKELVDALDHIERVYGHADRKLIQDGSIPLTRKDIVALSAFHDSKIKEIHYLLTMNHWNVPKSQVRELDSQRENNVRRAAQSRAGESGVLLPMVAQRRGLSGRCV